VSAIVTVDLGAVKLHVWEIVQNRDMSVCRGGCVSGRCHRRRTQSMKWSWERRAESSWRLKSESPIDDSHLWNSSTGCSDEPSLSACQFSSDL